MANEWGPHCKGLHLLPPSKHMYLGCGLSSIERHVPSTLLDLESLHLDSVILCSESDLDMLFDLSGTAAKDSK